MSATRESFFSTRAAQGHLSVFFFLFASLLSAALNTKDLDVFIKRNQESGFGFRVLGGEGPDQPVGNSCGGEMDGWMDGMMRR